MAQRENTAQRAKTPARTVRKENARQAAEYPKRTLALVYDFDGTLIPGNMQEYGFLPKIDVAPQDFWSEVNAKAYEDRAESLIVYMHLMYQKAKAADVSISRDDLVRQGADVPLFPGVASWFEMINAYVRERSAGAVDVRHYLVSSGLKEIIEGTTIVDAFHNVFASEYYFPSYELPYPKRIVTDTSKTQYLFRINKGIEDVRQSINHHMPEAERPIPFSNIAYFGDGETDVPSMAVVRSNGGYAVAVHPPAQSPEKCQELYRAGRIDFYAAADYRQDTDLHRRTRLILDRMLADISVHAERWALEGETRPDNRAEDHTA
ncbi:MAG: HAD family hydrolase [Pseudomonadota bacterium]